MKTIKDNLIHDLLALGVQKGDRLLVHSSYSAIGKNEQGPTVVIKALVEALGEKGTLLMPGFAAGSQYNLALENKTFEVRETPSQMGVISELFRKEYPTKRSLHPTHTLTGMGADAKEFLEGHEKCLISTGVGTPFEKLRQLNGKILLLGVDHASNTFLHYVENTLGAPTLSKNKFTMKVIDYHNRMLMVDTYPHLPGLPRNYERLNNELPESVQKKGKVGHAQAYLIEANALYEHLRPILKSNPIHLIKPFQI